MKKRGRPPKNRDTTAIAESPSRSVYKESYDGRRWWLLGIKVDQERKQLPCHSHVCGGINWQQGTQRQVEADGWMALDDHRTRVVRALYSWTQINRAVRDIRNFVVRWAHHTYQTAKGVSEGWRTEIVSLSNRYKVKLDSNKPFEPSGYRFHPRADDVPLSKYLILFPRSLLETKRRAFLPRIDELPSMFELDSSLISDRLVTTSGEEQMEDEIW